MRLDLEVKNRHLQEHEYKYTNTIKAKMVRDAEARAQAQSESGDEDIQSPQNHHKRRETILNDTTPSLRIWELDHLSEIKEWEEEDKLAALAMQKQIMEDYIKLADTYNALFTQSQEQEVQLQTQDTCIQELQDGIEQLQEVIQDDKETHEKQAAVIEYLQQQAQVQSCEGTPTSQVSTSITKNKSTKLPDPPILTDGKEPAYDDWIAKMQSKLEANQDHFPTPALQISYIQSRVVGTATLHINPRLRPTTTNKFKTVDEIFEVLDKVFSDPDRKYTARQAYRKLYQNKDTFATFWAEFQRLTVELDIDEETLINDLCHKVNTKM
jgi:hypothetical protein